MKRIKSIQLFLQEDTSDKVYEIDLLESGPDAYVVNFRFGRRGSALKEGTKTVFPVNLTEAEKLFAQLENEKRKKGYKGEGENPEFRDDFVRTKAEPGKEKRHKTIIKLLKAAANGEDHETWPLSRIVWRAGELGIEDAASLIPKVVDKTDPLLLYSCIWALGRLGDPKAQAFLEEITREKHPPHLIHLAEAALLNVSAESDHPELIKRHFEALPNGLKQAIASNDDFLKTYLNDLTGGTLKQAGSFLIPFYFVSLKDKRLRPFFCDMLASIPVKAGYFKYLRGIFKISQMLNDTEVYGRIAKLLEEARHNFTQRYDYFDGQWRNVSEILKREDSPLAFSKLTKAYFARRIMRDLRKLGEQASPLYTKYATDILLCFNDDIEKPSPYKQVDYGYFYNSETRSYVSTQTITWHDVYYHYKAFNYILYANSTRYTYHRASGRWRCVAPYEPGADFIQVREEAFAKLWNNAPDDIIRLLSQSRCEKAADFALFVFENNATFKTNITSAHLIGFVQSPSLKVQTWGFSLIKELLGHTVTDVPLLIALLISKLEEARLFAQNSIQQNAKLFCNHVELISGIVCHSNTSNHRWLQLFLQAHPAERKTQQDVMDTLLLALDEQRLITETDYIQSLTQLIESVLPDSVMHLEAQTLFNLLLHPNSAIQGLGARLLVLRRLAPSEVQDKTIFALLQSDNGMARSAAIDLLNQLEPLAIKEKQSLVLSLCLSPLQDVRQASQKLIDKLLQADPDAGYSLANLFIPVLTVKEKHEGLHADILQLITVKLLPYLQKAEVKKVLSLCTSRYIAAQELGNMLLEQYIPVTALQVKDVVSIGNSNLLKNREFVIRYFEAQTETVKQAKKDSIMLADSLWEEVRQFAFTFFKNHFTDSDWTPELFIALCDSLKPDVQAFGREMITTWFKQDDGFDYLLKLSQHPDSRMQLFASGFLEQYAKGNGEVLQKLQGFLITLLSQVNKGRTAKLRAIELLRHEALQNEQNAVLIAGIFNRMSATASVQDKALYIEAMLHLTKRYPSVSSLLKTKSLPVYSPQKRSHAV